WQRLGGDHAQRRRSRFRDRTAPGGGDGVGVGRRLPGPDVIAQPGTHHWPPDDRGGRGPPADWPSQGARDGRGPAARAQRPGSATSATPLSARAVGRDAERVMIAMGLMHAPALLIADEPTTSLDLTIQAQLMELFHRIN